MWAKETYPIWLNTGADPPPDSRVKCVVIPVENVQDMDPPRLISPEMVHMSDDGGAVKSSNGGGLPG